MKDYRDIYLMLIVGTLVFACLIFFVIYFVISYKRRQELYRREKRELELHFQQEILKSQLEIQEETFKHISQEIHDNVTQVLSLVKLNLGTLDMVTAEEAARKVDDSRLLVGKALKDLRQLSHTLHPDYMLEKGLRGAIEYTLDILRKTDTWTIEFEFDGEEQIIDLQKELILFRLVQESLNNIIRHAAASNIKVRLVYEIDHLTIRIEDNGKGFDNVLLSSGNERSGGLGIRNMGSRAQLIGAQFSITSEMGNGTVIFLSLPF